jgi:hypothetical protein
MRSIVIWVETRERLAAIRDNSAALGVAAYESPEGRWIVEFGDDNYVGFTEERDIWVEYDEETRLNIQKRFSANPLAILFEYRDRETARQVLVAALEGVDAQVEDASGTLIDSDAFRRQLEDGTRLLQ